MVERFRSELIERMAVVLNTQQMSVLENVLIELLHQYNIEARKNEVIVYDGNNERIISTFLASMRLEGLAESSLEQCRRAIVAMIEQIGKNIKDITTNDIRYHLSVYQSKGVSKVSVNNKRRYLSAFFAWLTSEDLCVIFIYITERSKYLLHRWGYSIVLDVK